MADGSGDVNENVTRVAGAGKGGREPTRVAGKGGPTNSRSSADVRIN